MTRARKNHNNPELRELVRNISRRLRDFRELEGISQNELARRAGISKSTVSEIENHVATDLQFSTVCQLASVFGKRFADFLVTPDLPLSSVERTEFLTAAEDLERASKVIHRLKRKVK